MYIRVKQDPISPHNGDASPRENGTDARIKRERPPSRSGSSSNSSTPLSTKPKEHSVWLIVCYRNTNLLLLFKSIVRQIIFITSINVNSNNALNLRTIVFGSIHLQYILHTVCWKADKPPTPVAKPITPTSSGSTTPSSSANKTPKPTTSIGKYEYYLSILRYHNKDINDIGFDATVSNSNIVHQVRPIPICTVQHLLIRHYRPIWVWPQPPIRRDSYIIT